ncbi:ArsR/SmtB family transcription factor [Corynebacterium pygosceleis]|uniref:ArsR/SmtB family transcription factor n=1 Tax=Corynebacterium pygosceleis TaxID=2800406 RepID=UPI0020033ED2|nr:metalloregulator ArsR/SmtB family transcription factor [Corynebacterium pygosceleis]MCK7674641.1 metalloregulator ArsR/SmtB family transcription factor [Corynebacterium pygosceleis]MCL0119770.1 metalloregulator ArsR/SmtB family transcription factor [Corynebacterium pygosceleis]
MPFMNQMADPAGGEPGGNRATSTPGGVAVDERPRPTGKPAVRALPPELSERASELFKALGDPTRLRLLYLIAGSDTSEICSHELSVALEVSAPTITHHMKKLAAARLVNREQRGKWAYYTVNPDEFDRIHALIHEL